MNKTLSQVSSTTPKNLTLFFDSSCPLCTKEMHLLKQADSNNLIEIEDILASDFTQRYPDIDPVKANIILHGRLKDGRLLLGLDATAKAWALTGKKTWVQWFRLPLIKPIADLGYKIFAKHRYRISYLLTGKYQTPPCKTCLLSGKHSEKRY
ncbi:hypothetical protein ABT56_11390 [Photobacterium aquae]|uniref:Thiol-disulfide oxidoreductase n=1 Tax=Photobacterium aquae TaxID=1195763 RepID=A0A0J1H162_9GAMM|nr:DUF393 domain-containing protein [Photobacterium aquae]KLV05561.1 hypothetical protein ABT56_11390 [Photobacterium aquae]